MHTFVKLHIYVAKDEMEGWKHHWLIIGTKAVMLIQAKVSEYPKSKLLLPFQPFAFCIVVR